MTKTFKSAIKFIIVLICIASKTYSQEASKQASVNPINLGPQLFQSSLNGSTFMTDKSGKVWLYTIQTGTPSKLLGYDQKTGKLETNLNLPGVTGSWAITGSTDGILYIASNQGIIYKHEPGTNKATSLGKAWATESYTWDIVAGKNGEVFIATYPGCRVMRYHPNDGFKDIGNGPLISSENYVRGLAYYAENDKIYAGIGSHTGLIELDVRTGQKKEILPVEDRGLTGFVSTLSIIKGLNDGDRLLASMTGKTLVYNLKTAQYESPIKNAGARTATKSSADQKIYFSTASSLWSYEITKTGATPVLVGNYKNSLARYWASDEELNLLTSDLKFVKLNVTTKKANIINLEVPPLPIHIQTTAKGGDGRIWTSGYPIGSNGAYNPKTGKTENYLGLPQAESISFQNDQIFFGIYGGAKIYRFDTKKAWSMADGNPKLIGNVSGQDRPFGNLSIPELGKMYFGTVPGYGKNGGALVEYDSSTDKLTPYINLIENHSIVSLTYTGKDIIGGTSTWGGLGIKPIATEAKLFGWDPIKKNKTFEIVPVSDAKAITCVMKGPDGNIWGIADGTLFIFNPSTQKVISKHELFDVPETRKASHVWKNAYLTIHPSGRIFGVGYGDLFELNAKTKAKTTLTKGAGFSLATDDNGNLYYNSGINLFKYTP